MAFRSDPAIKSGQFVTLPNGVRLHYASYGEPGAPLVLMLHGFPQYWYAWHDMMSQINGDYFVVAPDMRGYNLSDKPADVDAYRINHLSNDIIQLIQALGYTRTKLIAHDWGGAVAYAVTIYKPEMIEALMIINATHPVPFARQLAHDPAQQQASRYMNMLRQPGSEQVLLADSCAQLFEKFKRFGDDHWLTDQVAAQYRAAWTVPGAMTGAVNYYRASPLYPPQANDSGAAGLELDPAKFKVPVPTHIVWGMRDTALLPSLIEGMDEFIADLQIVRIQDGSHWIIHERPAQVAQEINRFVRRFENV